ncbi:MAG: hypothetical protein ACK4M2_01570 [Brevundimonas sp.]
MRRLFLRARRRPAFTRTLSAHGMRTLIVCAVVALICTRLFGAH